MNKDETIDQSKRLALSRLGLGVAAVYAAPMLLTISQSADAGGYSSGSNSGPSGGSNGDDNGGSDDDGNGDDSGSDNDSDSGSSEGTDRDDWDCNYTVNKRSDRCER